MKLESDQNSLAHCGRRNNAVLTRIPEIVKGNELEDVVLKIFNDIDANVQSSNIEICHRFSKPETDIPSNITTPPVRTKSGRISKKPKRYLEEC